MIGRTWRGMPPLFRFMALHLASGIGVGWALLAAILAADVSGLGSLVRSAPDGLLAVTVLAAFFAISFGAAGLGIAVINLPWEDDAG
jgi:hypothetical protein